MCLGVAYCLDIGFRGFRGVLSFDTNNVHGLRPLGGILQRKLHSLTFVQISVALALDSGVMDKDILFLIIGFIVMLGIPLAIWHFRKPSWKPKVKFDESHDAAEKTS